MKDGSSSPTESELALDGFYDSSLPERDCVDRASDEIIASISGTRELMNEIIAKTHAF